jgi:DNA-binding CsgD family transcriptional regulator
MKFAYMPRALGRTSTYAVADDPGIIVLDRGLKLMASNPHAVQILTFPERPYRIPDLHDWLSSRIRAILFDQQSAATDDAVAQFESAKRTYLCRSIPIYVRVDALSPDVPAVLLLLQRKPKYSITLDGIAKRFSLTPREIQTVKLLLGGLTSKEIGNHMKISPNTVKAFIRQIMIKMKVSTRSGIIGKIALAQQQ